MSASGLIIGGALCIAAYGFHWRARLLGGRSKGWPVAPRLVRWVIDAAALTLLLAGLWQLSTGKIPAWLQAVVSVVLAGYAVIFAANISQQRQPQETGK